MLVQELPGLLRFPRALLSELSNTLRFRFPGRRHSVFVRTSGRSFKVAVRRARTLPRAVFGRKLYDGRLQQTVGDLGKAAALQQSNKHGDISAKLTGA